VFQGGETIRGATVVPDGKQLVIADNEEVVVWDVGSGRRVASVPRPEQPKLLKRAFRPTGPMLLHTPLTTNGKELIMIRAGVPFQYTMPPKGEPKVLSNPTNLATRSAEGIAVAAFSRDDRLFAVTGSGRLVERKAQFNGEIGWTDTGLAPATGSNLLLEVGGDVLAVAGQDGRVRLWDAAKGKSLGEIELTAGRSFILRMGLSADGKYLAANSGMLGGEKLLQIWTVADLKEIHTRKMPAHSYGVALSPDGAVLAIESAPKTIELYDTKTWKLIHTLKEADDQSRGLSFLPDGSTLFGVSRSGVVRQWDVRTGKPVGVSPVGHSGSVTAVVSTKTGGWVTAGEDRTARLWGADGKEVRRFEGHTLPVTSAALSADGKVLFTAGLDCTVRAWDVEKGTELRKSEARNSPLEDVAIQSLALSPDGKTLALGVARGKVRLLDSGTLESRTLLECEDRLEGGWAESVAFAGDKRLVSRASDHSLRVWNLEKGVEERKFPAHGGGNDRARVAVSPDGKTVVSPAGRESVLARQNYDLGIWDTATGKQLARLDIGSLVDLTAVAYLPDGKSVAVGDVAGRVLVIDLEKKAVAHRFNGHRGAVLSLAVSPDGTTVASGGEDTTVLVWDLTKPAP
jgi:WD40 repeat protein